MLQGSHTGGVIVGKENPHATSFMTANELAITFYLIMILFFLVAQASMSVFGVFDGQALKSRRLAAYQNKNVEQSQQTSASFEAVDFPSQNSMKSTTPQEKS